MSFCIIVMKNYHRKSTAIQRLETIFLGVNPLNGDKAFMLLTEDIHKVYFPILFSRMDFQSLEQIDFLAKDVLGEGDLERSFVGRVIAARGFYQLASNSYQKEDFKSFSRENRQAAWSYDCVAKLGIAFKGEFELSVAICGLRSAEIYEALKMKKDYFFAARRAMYGSSNFVDNLIKAREGKSSFQRDNKDKFELFLNRDTFSSTDLREVMVDIISQEGPEKAKTLFG